MDKSTVTEQDYFGAVSALKQYPDLSSCLDNGPMWLIEVCQAYIENSGDKKEETWFNQLLAERGFKWSHATTKAPSSMWTNPRDGITTPKTFA